MPDLFIAIAIYSRIASVCAILLYFMSPFPTCFSRTPNALMHLQVLNIILSQDVPFSVTGSDGLGFCTAITEYSFKHNLYELLRVAIQQFQRGWHVEYKKNMLSIEDPADPCE